MTRRKFTSAVLWVIYIIGIDYDELLFLFFIFYFLKSIIYYDNMVTKIKFVKILKSTVPEKYSQILLLLKWDHISHDLPLFF